MSCRYKMFQHKIGRLYCWRGIFFHNLTRIFSLSDEKKNIYTFPGRLSGAPKQFYLSFRPRTPTF